ncbi:MAG: glycosyltransferase family 4 protein [Anaerolineae bacterium]|nr:glycosyltransferase family 4 protein [Anaerolineae bacterium]
MPQNLFIATGIFHPEPGGPATYLREILPALQQKGWSPSVLTYGDAPTADYPYPVTRVPRRTLPLRLWQYRQQAQKFSADADLIYAHTVDLPVPWGNTPRIIKIVGDQAWERCIRRRWIPVTTDIDEYQHGDFGWLANQQRESRSRQVRGYNGVIVPSEYLKRMVQGWGVPEKNIHVIYNAIPAAPENLPGSQQAARQLLGWDDTPTILTAARLHPWKGVDHLIAALQDVPYVRLMIAGEGPELSRLQIYAEKAGWRVHFLGQVPREQLAIMMQAADYFALYSGYEGLPHSLLEALRVGTPVIASDKGGNPEVVQHNMNGLLVPYVDIPALTETIEAAFQPGKREALAKNSRIGMERFDFSRMVSETDRVLRRY